MQILCLITIMSKSSKLVLCNTEKGKMFWHQEILH